MKRWNGWGEEENIYPLPEVAAAYLASLIGEGSKIPLEPIDMGLSIWAELRWAARAGGVVHLDDLLLRLVRLGLTLPLGGLSYMKHIHDIVVSELGWDEIRWSQEVTEYTRLWKQYYSFPGQRD
jgi:glycerol-3-phosphate dehydrogenase